MRIKSYFASSVQSAIAIARKEYGDDVTLVTSHTAPLESRHLGDYEVVFAVDETPLLAALAKKPNSSQVIKASAPSETAKAIVAKDAPQPTLAALSYAVAIEEAAPVAVLTPEPAPEPVPVAPPFQDLLQDAIATPLSTEQNVPEKLERVHSILVEMGIDAPMVRALMTMIERTVSAQLPPMAAAAEPAEFETVTAEDLPETIAAEAEVVEPEPAAPAVPDLTPAELAFYLSVSVGS